MSLKLLMIAALFTGAALLTGDAAAQAQSAQAQSALAQSAQDSVRAAVNRLFTAMKNADSAQLQAAFDDSAVLQTITTDKDGKTSARSYPVAQFASAIGRLPKGSADEQITIESLRMDGPLAMVWAPYHFYYNGTLLHCGVDSFQLMRVNGIWKILYIVDTRKKGDCD